MAAKKPVSGTSLEQLRERIANVRAEGAAIENAPVPNDDLLPRVHAALDAAIARSQVRLLAAHADPRPGLAPNLPDVLGALAWLYGTDEIARLLAARIAEANREAGLPMRERRQRLVELKDQLFALELEEERRVLDAIDNGELVSRRADADPRALLVAWADDDSPKPEAA